MTSVEAGYEVRDEGAALRWFDELWNDPPRAKRFDEAQWARLDDASGRLVARELRTAPAIGASPIVAVEAGAVLANLLPIVVPLNADQAANNVRTLRLIDEILNDEQRLKGKALSDFKLLGLAREGACCALAWEAEDKPVEEVARI